MNLIDAIKSGKRFRREGSEVWYPIGGYMASGGKYYYTQYDIMADDWITEEPAKQKVTMWQALHITTSGRYSITESLFRDEKAAKDWLRSYTFIKLVNPIEVEL